MVRVVQRVEPAVVSLFAEDATAGGFVTGSGALIHPDGYVLTNHHVLRGKKGYAIFRGKPVGFQVVGSLPEKDMAVVRLRGGSTPLPVVPLGQSHDVMNGESVVVMGNPGGRGIVVTSGVVSSNRQFLDGGNALVMTQFPNTRRDTFIQFDAASNRGNSGGPLINMEGELIGIVSALIPGEQNSSFAIPIDRVRKLLDRVVEPEMIHRRHVGIQLNTGANSAIIARVHSGSPASQAGLKSGDVIVKLDGKKLRHAVDWTLGLDRLLRESRPLELLVARSGTSIPMTIQPTSLSATEAVVVDGVLPGLTYDFYQGQFDALPDFNELQSERSGVAESLDLSSLRGDVSERYAVDLRGFIKVEQDGLYRLIISSDDGSRVHLHNEMFIDHDGNHPPIPMSRLARLKAGLHPIRIEYFQGRGGQSLSMRLVRHGGPLDADASSQEDLKWFHQESNSSGER